MVVFPNAKINIGLYITGKRPDGYHDLESVFYPVQCLDALEIIPDQSEKNGKYSFHSSGLPIAGNEQDNLCIKAYQLILKDFPDLPSVQIHLHKHIPMGAGLGGGSADGAYMLKLISQRFGLNLNDTILQEYALQLGSDCPFFIQNKPSFVSGRGEKLQDIEVNLSGYKILIVNPGIHVPTGWAFAQIQPANRHTGLADHIKKPVTEWKNLISNDFENPVSKAHPPVNELRSYLYNAGAAFVSMSGSGSTMFGIFDKFMEPELNFPSNYFYKWV